MDNQKKITRLYIIIAILGTLVFALGAYIIIDKITTTINSNKDNSTSTDNYSTNKPFVIDNEQIESAIKTSLIENIGKKDEGLGYLDNSNSILAEAHKTLRTELKDDVIYAYVVALIGTYTKNNETYNDSSAMAGPMVILFTKNYEFISYKIPEDGMGWTESLKSIFPSDLIDQATNVNYKDDFYQNQIKAYLK